MQKLESEEPNSTSPARVLREMQKIVRGDSDSSKMSISEFKAAWLRRILVVMKELNVAFSSSVSIKLPLHYSHGLPVSQN